MKKSFRTLTAAVLTAAGLAVGVAPALADSGTGGGLQFDGPAVNHPWTRGVYTASIKVTGTDSRGPVNLVKLYADGKLVATRTAAPWTLKYNTTGLNRIVRMEIIVSHNDTVYMTENWPIFADNTAPTVKVSSAPKSGSKVTGIVTVKSAVTDTFGVGKVELRAAGKVVATDTKTPWAISVPASKLPKKAAMTVRATDYAGNVKTVSLGTWTR